MQHATLHPLPPLHSHKTHLNRMSSRNQHQDQRGGRSRTSPAQPGVRSLVSAAWVWLMSFWWQMQSWGRIFGRVEKTIAPVPSEQHTDSGSHGRKAPASGRSTSTGSRSTPATRYSAGTLRAGSTAPYVKSVNAQSHAPSPPAAWTPHPPVPFPTHRYTPPETRHVFPTTPSTPTPYTHDARYARPLSRPSASYQPSHQHGTQRHSSIRRVSASFASPPTYPPTSHSTTHMKQSYTACSLPRTHVQHVGQSRTASAAAGRTKWTGVGCRQEYGTSFGYATSSPSGKLSVLQTHQGYSPYGSPQYYTYA